MIVNSDLCYGFAPVESNRTQALCEAMLEAEELVRQRREALEDAEYEYEYHRLEYEAAVNGEVARL